MGLQIGSRGMADIQKKQIGSMEQLHSKMDVLTVILLGAYEKACTLHTLETEDVKSSMVINRHGHICQRGTKASIAKISTPLSDLKKSDGTLAESKENIVNTLSWTFAGSKRRDFGTEPSFVFTSWVL